MRALIILLVSLVLVSACTPVYRVEEGGGQEPVIEHEPVVEEVPVNETAEVMEEVPVVTCEEWARSLFPVQWIFRQDVTLDPKLTKEPLTLYEAEWKDEGTIGGTSSTKVVKGSETGENINYYYTKPIYITLPDYGFTYKEQVIDDEGNILGVNAFKIRPVFRVIHDKVEDELDEWNITQKIRYLSLVIREPGFISCEKVD